MKNIYGISRKKIEEELVNMNAKSYNALQIYEWLYEKEVTSFHSMTNLKKELIASLDKEFSFDMIRILKIQEAKGTKKYLFELADKNLIEAVLMEHDYGLSVCISSQVGCNMGCTFCESGHMKKNRNLEVHEMVEQILLIESDIKKRVYSVVIMGIGEPLDNYDNVLDFIRIINDDKAFKIGARHITLSTCGLIPEIERLSGEDLQINLAISLHAPNDFLRNELMPVNKVYNIGKLIDTIKEYIAKTNRRVSIEYVTLSRVNDTKECATQLSNLLKGLNVYVNLIPYNETSASGFKNSSSKEISEFYDTLKKNKINVTIRKKFGEGIDAACGQLRSKGGMM